MRAHPGKPAERCNRRDCHSAEQRRSTEQCALCGGACSPADKGARRRVPLVEPEFAAVNEFFQHFGRLSCRRPRGPDVDAAGAGNGRVALSEGDRCVLEAAVGGADMVDEGVAAVLRGRSSLQGEQRQEGRTSGQAGELRPFSPAEAGGDGRFRRNFISIPLTCEDVYRAAGECLKHGQETLPNG